MIFKHILAATAAILVFPIAAQAETIVQTTTETTTTVPTGYKETTVLKGYKVTTVHPGGSSAPVAGETHFRKGTVFVPADQAGMVPLTTDGVMVHQTEYHFEKSYKGPTTFNE